jgi:hypothetical protein
MLDNVVSCKLYRPGSVAYVSKSGGMSNELNNMLARVTDGVAEGACKARLGHHWECARASSSMVSVSFRHRYRR